MYKKPRFELIEALSVAAADANVILDKKYDLKDEFNPDVILWETMLKNKIYEPGEFIVGIIAECGLERYLQMRRAGSTSSQQIQEAA